MKPVVTPMMKRIVLDMQGRTIDLQKLHDLLKSEGLYQSNYDKDSNPYCNYLELEFSGKARLFSSGKITTNLNFPDEDLKELFYRMQTGTIMQCLKERDK